MESEQRHLAKVMHAAYVAQVFRQSGRTVPRFEQLSQEEQLAWVTGMEAVLAAQKPVDTAARDAASEAHG